MEKLETPLYSVKAHKEIINSIDGVGGLGIGEGAPEIVTSSRDGKKVVFVIEKKSNYKSVCVFLIELKKAQLRFGTHGKKIRQWQSSSRPKTKPSVTPGRLASVSEN